jgi:hypothetical protein
VPTRPGIEFYEAGRVASTAITVPDSRCTTIAVSNIRDPRVRGDHCQTFLVAFLSTDGTDPTYTEPVEACSRSASKRIVLATNVPDGAVFRVLYQVDYIDPVIQTVGSRSGADTPCLIRQHSPGPWTCRLGWHNWAPSPRHVQRRFAAPDQTFTLSTGTPSATDGERFPPWFRGLPWMGGLNRLQPDSTGTAPYRISALGRS